MAESEAERAAQTKSDSRENTDPGKDAVHENFVDRKNGQRFCIGNKQAVVLQKRGLILFPVWKGPE